MEDLPIMPRKMEIQVIRQTGGQYQAVKQQIHRKDVKDIVIATDAGREGELVARWILKKAGNQKPCRRLWISSVTDKAIREGFSHLRDARDIEIAYKATEEGMHFIENQPPSLETLIVEFTKIKMQNMGITEDLSAVRTMEDMHKFLEALVACEKKLSSQGEKIGRHRGIEKGVRQGLSQGKLQASRETLLDLLEDRFGSLPKSVSSHVEKEKDAQKLHRLILSVYRVGSLDAFVGKLGPMDNISKARTC